MGAKIKIKEKMNKPNHNVTESSLGVKNKRRPDKGKVSSRGRKREWRGRCSAEIEEVKGSENGDNRK